MLKCFLWAALLLWQCGGQGTKIFLFPFLVSAQNYRWTSEGHAFIYCSLILKPIQTQTVLVRVVSASYLEDVMDLDFLLLKPKLSYQGSSSSWQPGQERNTRVMEIHWLMSRVNGGNHINQTTRQESKLRRRLGCYFVFKLNSFLFV